MTAPIATATWGLDIPTSSPTVSAEPWQERFVPTVIDLLRAWIELPSFRFESAPEPQWQAVELLEWSGLSKRQLSEILGTTHPTISALVAGQARLAKKPQVVEGLASLHALASRLAPFELERPGAIKLALLHATDSGDRVADLAVSGRLPEAYNAALRVIRPSERRPLKRTSKTREAGTATIALSDD